MCAARSLPPSSSMSARARSGSSTSRAAAIASALRRSPRCTGRPWGGGPSRRGPALAQLFAEEPGVVVQILAQDEPRLESILARHGLADAALYLGAPVSELRVRMRIGTQEFDESWADLRRAWSETSWRMRRLRDDPECADEEFAAETAEADPGLSVALRFDPEEDIAAPYVSRGVRPALAI